MSPQPDLDALQLACPITAELFEDPVILVEDGYTYERSAVTAWLEQNDTSPMSGAALATKTLAPNIRARQQADAARGGEPPSDGVRTNEATRLGEVAETRRTNSTFSATSARVERTGSAQSPASQSPPPPPPVLSPAQPSAPPLTAPEQRPGTSRDSTPSDRGLHVGDVEVLLWWRARNSELANRWSIEAHPTTWDGVHFDSSTPRRVTQIRLTDEGLDGSIPEELGQLASLQVLELYNNELSGSIPKELGQLASLQKLSLINNQLSGSIPKELGQLASLQKLDLTDNQLSGSIPKELGQLASLEGLDLSNNQLSGSIPKELGQLASLRGLWLYHNQLSGSIPEELRRLA